MSESSVKTRAPIWQTRQKTAARQLVCSRGMFQFADAIQTKGNLPDPHFTDPKDNGDPAYCLFPRNVLLHRRDSDKRKSLLSESRITKQTPIFRLKRERHPGRSFVPGKCFNFPTRFRENKISFVWVACKKRPHFTDPKENGGPEEWLFPENVLTLRRDSEKANQIPDSPTGLAGGEFPKI